MRTSARVRAAGLLLSAGLTTAAAAGHGGLVDSEPAADTTVTIAPLFVRLDFGHDLLDLGAAVRVISPSGAVVSAGLPRLYPRSVVQTLSGKLPAGSYQVSWRVAGEDGLPLSGQFRFSTLTAGDTSVAPAAVPADPGTATTALPVESRGGNLALLLAAIALGVLGVVVLLLVAVVRIGRRRRAGQGASR